MVQSIFEEMGGRYERQGEYILPCLTIPPEKEQSIDLFGRRHLDYLREYRKITYTNLLTSGRLNAYLADIDRQAQEHFERLIYPKVKGNKIQNGGGKDIGFPFRRVKAGIKKAVTQKNALRSCPQR